MRSIACNAPFVAVSQNGQLLPEVKRAFAVIAKNNFTLASGHGVPKDALLAFREAKAAGVQHLIATHAADAAGKMTLDQMKEAARLGAWIEFDYRNTLEENRTDLIRGVGPEHVFFSEFWRKNQAPKEYAGAAGVGAFAGDEEARLHRPRTRNDVQGQSGEGNRIVGGDAVRKKLSHAAPTAREGGGSRGFRVSVNERESLELSRDLRNSR
jgi:hypothetical protein